MLRLCRHTHVNKELEFCWKNSQLHSKHVFLFSSDFAFENILCCGQIRHLEKEKAVKFLVGQDIAKVNCMKWSGGDIKDLISPKVHLKTSIMEVTLPFIAWKHQLKIKNVITVGIVTIAFIFSAEYV